MTHPCQVNIENMGVFPLTTHNTACFFNLNSYFDLFPMTQSYAFIIYRTGSFVHQH